MELYFWLKFVHILGAATLFGTGMGIAFFMFMANRTGDPQLIAGTGRIVVIADMVFTAVAAILQPVTGAALVVIVGYDFSELWIWMSLALYVLIGACWLPVIGLQLRLRDLALKATETGFGLSEAYYRAMRLWIILGWPAFLSIIGIFALMIWKPIG